MRVYTLPYLYIIHTRNKLKPVIKVNEKVPVDNLEVQVEDNIQSAIDTNLIVINFVLTNANNKGVDQHAQSDLHLCCSLSR